MLSKFLKTSAATFLFLILAVSAFPQQSDTVRITLLHLNDTYQFTPVDGGTRADSPA